MGKVPWDVIKCNIPGGDLVACRVATDFLIVCGVSNWGAYALATGVAHARGRQLDAHLFDRAREQQILETMVKAGPLVDGVTAKPTATVDGLTWEQYANVLEACGRAASAEAPALPRER
jgi:ActR/RegA family two-component response regulator